MAIRKVFEFDNGEGLFIASVEIDDVTGDFLGWITKNASSRRIKLFVTRPDKTVVLDRAVASGDKTINTKNLKIKTTDGAFPHGLILGMEALP